MNYKIYVRPEKGTWRLYETFVGKESWEWVMRKTAYYRQIADEGTDVMAV